MQQITRIKGRIILRKIRKKLQPHTEPNDDPPNKNFIVALCIDIRGQSEKFLMKYGVGTCLGGWLSDDDTKWSLIFHCVKCPPLS